MDVLLYLEEAHEVAARGVLGVDSGAPKRPITLSFMYSV